jgi:hypothetical protein
MNPRSPHRLLRLRNSRRKVIRSRIPTSRLASSSKSRLRDHSRLEARPGAGLFISAGEEIMLVCPRGGQGPQKGTYAHFHFQVG